MLLPSALLVVLWKGIFALTIAFCYSEECAPLRNANMESSCQTDWTCDVCHS